MSLGCNITDLSHMATPPVLERFFSMRWETQLHTLNVIIQLVVNLKKKNRPIVWWHLIYGTMFSTHWKFSPRFVSPCPSGIFCSLWQECRLSVKYQSQLLTLRNNILWCNSKVIFSLRIVCQLVDSGTCTGTYKYIWMIKSSN